MSSDDEGEVEYDDLDNAATGARRRTRAKKQQSTAKKKNKKKKQKKKKNKGGWSASEDKRILALHRLFDGIDTVFEQVRGGRTRGRRAAQSCRTHDALQRIHTAGLGAL